MKAEHNTKASPARPARTLAKHLLIATVLVLPLAGCKHAEERGAVAGWALVDPAQRHPILVSQQPETLAVQVNRGSQGLTPQQRAEVLAFAGSSRASDAGNSRLVIEAPSGGANEVSAMYAVQEIRDLLSEQGFSEASIAVEGYPADGGGNAPVKVSYLRYVAEGPECGNWPTNLAREPQNLPMPNLGCANQKNLAAMVANPADLLGPRTEGERGSERRDQVWAKYNKGDVTATKRSEDERVKTQGSN